QGAGKRADAAMRQSSAAVSNLSFQLNDIAMQLASGTSPFTVMVQQGSQVAQVFQGSGGGLVGAVKTLGGAFATMINPVSLASFAIIGLTGAAVQYFTSLGSDATSAEDVLKGHADLIREIKAAYGEAAAGLEEYDRASKKLADNSTRKSIALYQEQLRTTGQALSGMLDEINPDDYRGSTFILNELRGALNELQESAKDGEPDIRKFLERLVDIKNLQGTPDEIKALIDRIVETGTSSVDVQGKLEGLQKFINGVGEASRSQAKQVDDFAKSIDKLANIALPQLSEMEQAAKAYSEAMRNATGSEERAMARLQFEQAQQRIRDQNPTLTNSDGRTVGVPTPSSRPLVEFDELPKAAKEVKDSFDGLTGTIDRYVDQIVKAESGGKADAKNPLSSATGLGQFIESTWLNLFKKNFPDRAQGMSDATILALRTDADISRSLIEAYARENADLLRQAGVAVNEAALHLAHFLGPGGAIDVLKAPAGTPVSSVLSQGAISANPTILGGGATVDDVIQYAEGRAGAYDRMREAARALKVEQKELNTATNEFANVGVSIVGGFINDLRNGVSAADALKNALNKVLDTVIEIGLKSIFTSGLGGGGGGLLGGMLIPGILHSGGVAGSDGYGHGRAVSPSTFAGAKRYHTGGVAGLQPGEVPAILQRGEVVLPRGTKVGSGGGSYAPTYNIDARGADQAAIARLERGLAERDRTEGKRVAGMTQTRQTRKTRP
ncbi:MAG TPA: phage tail length tape measure family protein, partial [Pseudorhizobium sp.]|nr:phage tail length tape measure family protein [Pseudorhizobium sp.]